jgi:hypothetical protein
MATIFWPFNTVVDCMKLPSKCEETVWNFPLFKKWQQSYKSKVEKWFSPLKKGNKLVAI